jgi:hypothetical protein
VETPEPLGKTLYLGALFGGWYAFNILFNMWVPALNMAPCYLPRCRPVSMGSVHRAIVSDCG